MVNFLFYTNSNNTIFVHSNAIEIVWITLFSLILLGLAYPSSVLCCLEETQQPELSFKVIGCQWYWSYEFRNFVAKPINETCEEFYGFPKLLQDESSIKKVCEKFQIFDDSEFINCSQQKQKYFIEYKLDTCKNLHDLLKKLSIEKYQLDKEKSALNDKNINIQDRLNFECSEWQQLRFFYHTIKKLENKEKEYMAFFNDSFMDLPIHLQMISDHIYYGHIENKTCEEYFRYTIEESILAHDYLRNKANYEWHKRDVVDLFKNCYLKNNTCEEYFHHPTKESMKRARNECYAYHKNPFICTDAERCIYDLHYDEEYSPLELELIEQRLKFSNYLLSSEYIKENNKIEFFKNLETNKRVCLPTNTHIRVLVTAIDILHSWTIPSLNIKIDACPGRLNQANLFIKRCGLFFGQCSEICGINHSFMPIAVLAVPSSEYKNFLVEQT